MITLRPAGERGHANHGWLDSYHSFSFADYFDPAHMGVSVLRVINDDTVAPGAGFATHGHRDMEIISYVLSGALEHKDSMGHGSVIRPGDVQRMSAGTGVRHSEYNASAQEVVNFLQIWILPDEQRVAPSYEQKNFGARTLDRWCLVASPDGREDSISMHQDAMLYATRLTQGVVLTHSLSIARTCYLHVARGAVRCNDLEMAGGDGATLTDESLLTLTGIVDTDVLLFDLP